MYRLRIILASAPPLPNEKSWVHTSNLVNVSWILLCSFVKLQTNVTRNKLWLLRTFQRKILKFIDLRGLRFYEYCVFSVVWNNKERILIQLLNGQKRLKIAVMVLVLT
jgi:hypothetical protein